MFKSLLTLLILLGTSMQIGYAADRSEKMSVIGENPSSKLLLEHIKERDDCAPPKVTQGQTKIDNVTQTDDNQFIIRTLIERIQWGVQYLREFWNDPLGFKEAFENISFD